MSARWSRLRWLAVAPVMLAVVTCLSACMSPGQRREESLQRVAHEFNDGLRWNREDQVMRCLPPGEAQLMRARRADLGDDFVVADHEVTSIMMAAGADKATVIADFSWFNQRRGVLQKSTIEEKWQWAGGRWLVTSQRRLSGQRFPLVPEHEGPRHPTP